jgi:hypothetical protein
MSDMSKKRRFKNKESAVSETVGYIIIFGIVMTGIGLVTLYGYPLLLQEQANANIKNMERNMIVLQNDMNSLTYKNVPYQETSLQVSGGTLMSIDSDQNPQMFKITRGGAEYFPFQPGELRFVSENNDAVISLENGAVHISYWSQEGSAMLSEPRWFFDQSDQKNTYIFTFIKLSSDSLAQTGIGTVQMKLVPTTPYEPIVITGESVTIEYHADPDNNYNVAWKNYFENPDLYLTEDGSSTAFDRIYNLDTTQDPTELVIKEFEIEILSL